MFSDLTSEGGLAASLPVRPVTSLAQPSVVVLIENKHQREENDLNKRAFDVDFQVFGLGSICYLKSMRRKGLGAILQPTTRGPPGCSPVNHPHIHWMALTWGSSNRLL